MPNFNAAALAIIDAVGGDPHTGEHCPCPVCGHNSLSVKNGDRVLVVVYCHLCGKEGGPAIIAKLREMGVWQTNAKLEAKEFTAQQRRSAQERRNYAVSIWNELCRSGARTRTMLLRDYLQGRGINTVPSTALVTLPLAYEGSEICSSSPGMVLPVRDRDGRLQGIQTTWLSPDMKHKTTNEPQRQSYGLIKSNFIPLTNLDYAKPPPTLLIGEGVETVLSGMQVTGLPGIVTAGAGMMKYLEPPRCGEYVILADNGDAGQTSASALASQLHQQFPDCTIRIATPTKPKRGKRGYDWNDLLMDGVNPTHMQQAISQAPIFDGNTDMGKKQSADDLYAQRIAKLANLTSRAYDAEREAIKKKFKVRCATIDKDVERYHKQRNEAERAEPPPPDIKKLAASAADIIACDNVLKLLADTCADFIAGEEKLIKTLYLSGTSRLFDDPMHTAVKGASAGGKSRIRRDVLEYFPPEAVFNFTTLSEKALLYTDDDFCHRILSMGEAFNAEEADFQNYILRELMSEGRIRHGVTQKSPDGTMRTVMIEKNGPVAFMVTTTRNKLHAENETRMLSLEIDDSAEQTRRVIEMLAEVKGFNLGNQPGEFEPWRDFQRWLAAGETRVFVPFSSVLSQLIEDTRSVRLRRDFGQLLCALKAHALLHREHRRRTTKGSIVATIPEDYRQVRGLLNDILATASELKTNKQIKETVTVVKKLADDMPYTDARSERDSGGVPIAEIVKAMKLDRSTVQRRLRAAQDAGLLFNLEDKRGRPGRFRVTGELEVPTSLLPTTRELMAAYKGSRQERRSASQ